MPNEVTLQLPDETARRLEEAARTLGRPVGELGAVMIEEWLRENEHSEIEFRDFQGERLACLKGLIRIWKIIMVARDYDFDVEKTAAHFDFPVHRIQAAFDYYRAYPEEADRIIAENDSWTYERIKQVLPNTTRTIVHLGPEDDKSLAV